MKKSSIFLSATAFVLAIAGAFATKAKTFANSYYYLTTGTGVNRFHAIAAPDNCAGTVTPVCRYTTAGHVNSYTVYFKTQPTGSYITAFKTV